MIDKQTAQHYSWGDECDGWHLVKTPTLSIIQESMPPGTSEVRHHHLKANQFFYVLHGTLSFEVGSPKASKEFDLNAGQGIEIIPGEIHQVPNRSASDVEFLVISNPPSHGDRISSE